MDMKQLRATNNGRYNRRTKERSIIMEQCISLTIIFDAYINDEE